VAPHSSQTLLLKHLEPSTSFVGGYTWTVSDSKVNNFRYGFTREAFTNQGDSSDNAITFRSVFRQIFFREVSAARPRSINFTDDFLVD
jgi:hypothetical protein